MKKRVLNKKIVVLFIIFSLFIVSGISFTLAKYTDVIKSAHIQKTSKFYFTSDYLTEEQLTYEIYKDTIGIELYNYDINNINNITTSDIIYNTSVNYYDESNNLIGNEIITTNNSSWAEDTIGKKSLFNLNSVNGAAYAVVKINSTSPYNKEIVGRFNFNGDSYVPMYSISKLTNGFTIEIMTANEDMNNLQINWPSVCGPDNTNPLMALWVNDTTNNYLGVLNANTTYSLNFYCTLPNVNVMEIQDQVLDTSVITVNL